MAFDMLVLLFPIVLPFTTSMNTPDTRTSPAPIARAGCEADDPSRDFLGGCLIDRHGSGYLLIRTSVGDSVVAITRHALLGASRFRSPLPFAS